MRHIKNYSLSILSAILMLLVAYWLLAPQQTQSSVSSLPRQEITVTTAVYKTHSPAIHILAKVIDHQATDVDSPLAENIEAIYVKQGDRVNKGQIIMKLSTQTLERQLKLLGQQLEKQKKLSFNLSQQYKHQNQIISQHKKLIDLSDKKAKRYKKLYDENLVSLQKLEDIHTHILEQGKLLLKEESQLLQLKRQMDESTTVHQQVLTDIANTQDNLSKSHIKSYFDGRVEQIYVRENAFVNVNEPLCHLQSFATELEAPLTFQQYQILKKNHFTASTNNLSLKNGQMLHQQIGKQPSLLWSTPTNFKPSPGESVKVKLTLQPINNSIIVPKTLVSNGQIYIVIDEELRGVPITVLAESDENNGQFIISGVPQGAQMLDKTILGPKEGLRVKVIR